MGGYVPDEAVVFHVEEAEPPKVRAPAAPRLFRPHTAACGSDASPEE